MNDKLTFQQVGAFGERAVEAELLRNGWMPANVNATVKNAKDYDIIAYRPNTEGEVRIRVKTCRHDQPGFQFGGLIEVETEGFPENDFTILVRMGRDRGNDQFYVVPTIVLRKQIRQHRDDYLSVRRKDGEDRKNLGHWTLHLADLKSGKERSSHGYARRWAQYLDGWNALEAAIQRSGHASALEPSRADARGAGISARDVVTRV
jgi:hypothetical protein